MYFLYVRGGSWRRPGTFHWFLLGIFPGSNYWTEAHRFAVSEYGEENITYRFHQKEY